MLRINDFYVVKHVETCHGKSPQQNKKNSLNQLKIIYQ